MRVIGLTGGIASGKSTVARMFADLGAVVLYADEIAREVVAPGQPALAEIRAAFGPAVIRADGTLDRAAMGERVFSDPVARRRLEAITHPRILVRIKEQLADCLLAVAGNPAQVVVLEHPLLIDAGHTDLVEGIILVVAQLSIQVARLMSERRFTEEQALARVGAQLSVEDQVSYADWIVDGDAPLPEVRRRVTEIWGELASRC